MLPSVIGSRTHLGLHVFFSLSLLSAFLLSRRFSLFIIRSDQLGFDRNCWKSDLIQELDMGDSKKAAKAFVDKYFPVKQANSKFPDVLSDLFPPNSPLDSAKKHGYEGSSSSSAVRGAASSDGRSHGKAGKSGGSPQKSGNAVVFCEASEACSMSSSVDYGCRDNYYPNQPANRQPGSYYEKKDKKDGYDCPDPEHSRGEWWQGSLYY